MSEVSSSADRPTRACEGLTILDLTQGMAGGLATMVLADAGAEVLKVEPPEGDWSRKQPAFYMWGRGKKSVVLDLKSAQGQNGLRSLVRVADVLLTAFSPEASRRLGVDYATLKKENPGLVACSITGFGPLKPYAHLKGYEGIVSAKTGRVHGFDNQIRKEGPTYAALNCASFGAAMYALQGIMAALFIRKRTGKGQLVETSLTQTLCAYDWGWLRWQLEKRPGAFKPFLRGTPTPQYFVGRSRDGRWMQMANSMEHLFANFIIAIGAGHVLDEPRYVGLPNIQAGKDMEELFQLVHVRLQEKTLDEWLDIFTTKVDAALEPFLTTQEAFDHPQVVHNGNIIELSDPVVGQTRQLGPLVNFTDTPMSPQGPAPWLGQHTREVLASLPKRKAAPRVSTKPMPKYPLEGVTVLEFATWFAAPFGTAILADMGARVIKVESLQGDSFRRWGPMASKMLQGKESIAIDLKNPEGQALAHKFIQRADILMHNFRPGAAERLGIGYEALHALNPRLVYLYAGAYGSTGPSSHRPAMHPIPGAICGGALYQAGRGMPPPPGQPLTYEELRETSSTLFRANEGNPDVSSALTVTTAMLMALYTREQTGKGQYLETTMLCSNLYANADDAISYKGKPDRLLPDKGLNGLHALYRFYRAKEGWVFLACVTQKEWEAFCQAVGREELLNDPRFVDRASRLKHDDALIEVIEGIFPERTAIEWESFLSKKDIGCCEVRRTGFEDFANADPSMKETGLWVETEHPSLGKYWRFGPAVSFSEGQGCSGPPIFVGEHTVPLLKEIGYGDTAIEDMRQRKIVAWTANETND